MLNPLVEKEVTKVARAAVNNSIKDLYKDKKFCFQEIGAIRKVIGSTEAGEKEFQAAFNSLGLMLIHCPEDITGLVQAQLSETTARHAYMVAKKIVK